ncbi:MAG: hypothetical protein EZS28_002362 [Streblomastix strix]|uniref:Uncharacterized protein n=1 Tax=Streblomastix strix TaxID=222440 RepID=A0A5J4X656_9EUKA|nr:MAG: hypothetical protein EZS28_002362 [Streblomastix strix]
MRTNVEKSIKSTNTLEEQHKYRVRRQLVIDAITNADYQQGTTRGNIKGNSGAGDKVMELNIPCAQTKWRMEKYLTLQDVQQRTYSQTIQDDRHMKFDLNAEKMGLDVHVGYNVCLQTHKVQLITTSIPSVPDTMNQLYISGNAIWDQYCAIHIRENDTTNSGESEREMRDANIELCG